MNRTGRGTLATYAVEPDASASVAAPVEPLPRPRLGFLGVGWIGRQRMEVLATSGLVDVVAIADPAPEMKRSALETVPGAAVTDSLDELLSTGSLDGLVIATPSALHAEQSIRALNSGLAVFCQKPLGRTAEEVEAVVEAARRADRLLGVDFSYRFVEAFRRVREVVRSGEIGRVYAAELVFHNAYGPDKSWFYDPALAGGGCVMDLGVHLVDTALWVLGFPRVDGVDGRLFARGERLGVSPGDAVADSVDDRERARAGALDRVEDYAAVRLDLSGGVTAQIACSWNLPAGQDAVISATFYGIDGGVCVRNVDGSFYEFVAELFRGTRRETLVEPPDEWPGRAAVDWARRLKLGQRFDAQGAAELLSVASTLDRIYRR